MDQGWNQLAATTGIDVIKRSPKVQLDTAWLEKNVQSGDCYCVFGASGTDSLIGWGTGSVCTHSGMFIWGQGDDSGTLHFIESRTGSDGQHVGTVSDKWTSDDLTARVLLKLDDEHRKLFDADKAWEFFYSVQYYPYGYENLISSFLDTQEDNLP